MQQSSQTPWKKVSCRLLERFVQVFSGGSESQAAASPWGAGSSTFRQNILCY